MYLNNLTLVNGTGLAACQMGPQLLHLKEETPEAVAKAATGFHCKDYLYLKLTGVRATDPTEGCCSFGDFRTRTYSDDVLHALGLSAEKHLLPPMVDGTKEQHALTAEAAAATGLPEGTPVALGYLDVPCTAMGAGIYDPHSMPGCSIVGSTGIHMKLLRAEDVVLNEGRSGYAMVLPVAGWVALLQSNMAATLNIDWILKTAAALLSDQGAGEGDFRTLLPHIDRWVADTEPGELIYHPYISEAGERGPIVDGAASASFLGLSTRHGFPHMVRAVLEGLGYAARDCYEATGGPPNELRLGGGAARSKTLRKILAAALDTPVRPSLREEMGAAGAAMIGAVGIGAYPSMDDCVKVWADPSVQDAEAPDPALVERYAKMFPAYLQARKVMQPLWGAIAEARHG
ncbi:MAG: FGGY-family carbohydrate kinase [Pseudomonadota bacterium]